MPDTTSARVQRNPQQQRFDLLVDGGLGAAELDPRPALFQPEELVEVRVSFPPDLLARPDGAPLPDRSIGKVYCRGSSVMHSYFRDEESTSACLSGDGWLDTGDMGYMSGGYIFIVGRAKDMIIINGRNYWPQDIEWAVEQLPGFKSGDIAAFAITGPTGEETPAVLVHCRISDPHERGRLRDDIRERVRAITGISPVVELIPPRTLPRTSSGKLSRTKARNLYLSGEIQPYDIAA